jgi:hypothetical protein
VIGLADAAGFTGSTFGRAAGIAFAGAGFVVATAFMAASRRATAILAAARLESSRSAAAGRAWTSDRTARENATPVRSTLRVQDRG